MRRARKISEEAVWGTFTDNRPTEVLHMMMRLESYFPEDRT